MLCARCQAGDLIHVGWSDLGSLYWCERCGTLCDISGTRTPDLTLRNLSRLAIWREALCIDGIDDNS